MKGTWWICAARTGLSLREMASLNEAIEKVGDPRAETLRWICKEHQTVDCATCLEGVPLQEHPFVSR